MAGKYDHDELFIALQKIGKTREEVETILNEVDSKGSHLFSIEFKSARKLVAQFNGQHPCYHVSTWGEGRRGFINIQIVSICAEPSAPWARCLICQTPVKTCERKKPAGNDYRCPVHSEGAQLSSGAWVCSPACWELAAERRIDKLSKRGTH